MDAKLTHRILEITEGSAITDVQVVQSLWSGYGELLKCKIAGSQHSSVIVKHIQLPAQLQHPRGWNTHRSHERKRKSYQVEMEWYRGLANRTTVQCRIPRVLETWELKGEMGIVMEDLDSAGYSVRKSQVSMEDIQTCLRWLAHFHGTYMHVTPVGLWEIGSYWHLNTRPDEWESMEDQELKQAASAINKQLSTAKYQTIIHGDAKLANFCFAAEGNAVAAVDFQYVGGGCGMKDVAYFLSSCLLEEACEQHEEALLTYYFNALKEALHNQSLIIDYEEVMTEWKKLYRYAWADFYRFLDGWSPGHWKMHRYSRQMKEQVLLELDMS